MAGTEQQRVEFIRETRNAADALVSAVDKLTALRATWDAGMSTWLVDASGNDPAAEGYAPGDFIDARGLMKADIAAVLGTTLDALHALLAQGHRTNLEAVRL